MEFDSSPKKNERDLISQVKKITNKKFILVDTCENIKKVLLVMGKKNEFCILTKKNDTYYSSVIDHNMSFSAVEIKDFVGY